MGRFDNDFEFFDLDKRKIKFRRGGRFPYDWRYLVAGVIVLAAVIASSSGGWERRRREPADSSLTTRPRRRR